MRKIWFKKILPFIFCTTVVLHDLYKITIYSWLNEEMYGFTYFGLITFVFCLVYSIILFDDIKVQRKSIRSHRSKFGKDTSK